VIAICPFIEAAYYLRTKLPDDVLNVFSSRSICLKFDAE